MFRFRHGGHLISPFSQDFGGRVGRWKSTLERQIREGGGGRGVSLSFEGSLKFDIKTSQPNTVICIKAHKIRADTK